jgi:CheY-like chemotaxis protein
MAFSTQTAWKRKLNISQTSCRWILDCRQQSLEAGFEHHLAEPVDPQTLQELMAARAKQLSTR